MNTPVAVKEDEPKSTPARDPRTQRLLQAPVLPTLLRLAAPNMGEAAARVAFIACDALFVSWLGTDALAAIAIVFPLFLITQMISAGGIGAGVAAAMGRAIGADEQDLARSLAGQALMLAVVFGLVIAAGMLVFGSSLFTVMGARGAVLEQALVYSALVFGGGVLVWLMNLGANILRGTGNMMVPASAIVSGEIAHLLLSPALILGWGPLPALGIAGAGIGVLASYGIGSAIILIHIFSGRALVRPRIFDLLPRRQALMPVMRVGTFSALNVLQFQLTTLIMTAFVGTFGAASLAGFGAALRLELLQIPIIFAFGSAVIAMTATNAGAGAWLRVRQVAWAGAGLATAIGALFAAVAMLLPNYWMGLLTSDVTVVAAGTEYLRMVGLTLPFLGLAFGLFFVALGVGVVVGPFLIGVMRLAIIAVGGGLALLAWETDIRALYITIAVAYAIYGLGMAWLARRLLRQVPRES